MTNETENMLTSSVCVAIDLAEKKMHIAAVVAYDPETGNGLAVKAQKLPLDSVGEICVVYPDGKIRRLYVNRGDDHKANVVEFPHLDTIE